MKQYLEIQRQISKIANLFLCCAVPLQKQIKCSKTKPEFWLANSKFPSCTRLSWLNTERSLSLVCWTLQQQYNIIFGMLSVYSLIVAQACLKFNEPSPLLSSFLCGSCSVRGGGGHPVQHSVDSGLQALHEQPEISVLLPGRRERRAVEPLSYL